MNTRFIVGLRSRDSGPHRTLYADADAILVPRAGPDGDDVIIWDGYTVAIHSVSVAPTMDPMIYVRCRSITCETTAEVNEIVDQATRKEGWRVIG